VRVISEVTSLLIHDLVEATDAILTASLPVSSTPPPRIAHVVDGGHGGGTAGVPAHALLPLGPRAGGDAGRCTRIRALFHGLVADPSACPLRTAPASTTTGCSASSATTSPA